MFILQLLGLCNPGWLHQWPHTPYPLWVCIEVIETNIIIGKLEIQKLLKFK